MKNKLTKMSLLGMIFTFSFALFADQGGFGSRGIETVYEFKNREELVKIMKKNIRLGPDRYYAVLKDGENEIKIYLNESSIEGMGQKFK